MNAEAARIEEIAASTEPKLRASEERERLIEFVAGLLSSGHPLSEILQSVRRVEGRTDAVHPEVLAERDTQLILSEFRGNRTTSETTHVSESVDSTARGRQG